MAASRPRDTQISRTSLLRSAKLVADELRVSLKAEQDPTDAHIDFLRQKLRHHYTSFLFASATPSARANDVVNLCWLESSHALIARHRERIARIDNDIELQKRQGKPLKHNAVNPVTRRKLVHALRDFLTAEETFYSGLIGKLVDTFRVERARMAARTLGIQVAAPSDRSEAGSEAATSALALVQTALVFYGDLARYTQLYKESKEAAGRGGRFERAAECYHQARLLAPSNGRPDNQLAVIASASKDSLSAAFHYMRAVSVRSGFETARANLDSTYRQAMSEYRASGAASQEVELGERTRKAFIVLLGMLVRDDPKDVQAAQVGFETQLAHAKTLFGRALEERALPSEHIIKILLLVIGTCWDARLGGDPSSAKRCNELKLLELVLDILTVLFTVSTSMTEQALDASLEVPRPEDPNAIFATRISAPVRRIAPSLRIASIWMLGNLDRIDRANNKEAFWTAYSGVVNMLVTAFPPDVLPSLPSGANLEEDFELLGFLPCPLPQQSATTAFVADHPNSEFLFRIQGFVSDASLVVGQSRYLQQSNGLLVDRLPSLPTAQDAELADADEDVVSDAMREARLDRDDLMNDEDDEEEDEEDILYVPRPLPSAVTAETTAMNGGSKPGSGTASPVPQTAGDLLLSVLSGGQEQSIWAPVGGENRWPVGRT